MGFTLAQQQAAAFERLASKFPRRFKARTNRNLRAILLALASGDGFLDYEVEAVRDNLILVTATGKYLEARAALYGVVRTQGSGVQDSDFQRLAPLVGMSPKQVVGILNKIIDVVYGPYATRANTTCTAPAPYYLQNGWDLRLVVDGQPITIKFQSTDFADVTHATAQEVADAVSVRSGGRAIGTVISDAQTGAQTVNVASATIGSQGFVQVLGGAAQPIMLFPTVRPTVQGTSTWNVTRVDGSDQMLYSFASGTDPQLVPAGVRTGDYLSIRQDSGFMAVNCGTFQVNLVTSSSFTVVNPLGVPEGPTTTLHANDLSFHQAQANNVLLLASPATVVVTSPGAITVDLPVTSPLVKRFLAGSAHLHGGITTALSYDGLGNLSIGSATGFPPSGAVQPSATRHNARGVVSSVGANSATLVNAQGWPSSGAFWSQSTGQFYFYSGLSGSTLTGVQPSPPGSVVGGNCAYSQMYSYTGVTGNTLNGVYPSPAAIVGLEVEAAGAQLVPGFPGSFVYDPKAPFILSATAITTAQAIDQGSSLTVLQVAPLPAGFPQSGSLVFNVGLDGQEGPVKYNAVVGNSALLLDASHVFKSGYPSGSSARLVAQMGPYAPRVNGQDLPVYLTSTSPARDLVSGYLEQVAAAGIVVTFRITLPESKWPILPPLYSTDPLSALPF